MQYCAWTRLIDSSTLAVIVVHWHTGGYKYIICTIGLRNCLFYELFHLRNNGNIIYMFEGQ